LPVDEVRPGFENVKATLDDQSLAKSLMQQLIRYVEKQWLDKSTDRTQAQTAANVTSDDAIDRLSCRSR